MAIGKAVITVLEFFYFREKLQLEIAAREKAEKKHQEYEERLKSLQDEMIKREQELQEAQVFTKTKPWRRKW